MRTTTVIWNEELTPETYNLITNKVLELLPGEEFSPYQDLYTLLYEADNQRKAVRSWPDLATAEAWIEFIQTLDTKPVSAVVDPE